MLDQFVHLDCFLSHAVPHTQVHEGVKNYHVQVVRRTVFSSQQVSQVAAYLRKVLLSSLDLSWVLQVDELAVSQDLEASKKLRNCEVVRMNAFLLFDVLKDQLKTLDEVLDFLEEALLVELLDHVLFLFQCCH